MKRWGVVAVVIAVLVVGWVTRYEYIRHERAYYTKVNRWTGQTWFCGPQECSPVQTP